MMTDDELRRLAEAAPGSAAEWWTEEELISARVAPCDAAFIAAANPKAVKCLLNRLRDAEDQAKDARATLEAWFDMAAKMESAGADVLRDSLDTWLRRASSGGMPKESADIARTVLDGAARIYLWKALVPVLRGMTAQAEGWQPIETAPRDAEMLVSSFQYNDPSTARFIAIAELSTDGHWRDAYSGERLHEPTHWRPLPTPPEPTP